jgi:hypothetical protein
MPNFSRTWIAAALRRSNACVLDMIAVLLLSTLDSAGNG